MAAVSSFGQVVAQDVRSRAAQVPATRHEEKLEIGTHAARRRCAGRSRAQHAQLALESEGSTQFLAKERTLGAAANMAAPSGFSSNVDLNEDSQPGVSREIGVDQTYEDVIIVLDSDDDLERANELYGEGCSQNLPVSLGLAVQGGRQVQWIPRQVEFVDEQGSVIRGTICGATVDDGMAGSAQVRMDFWQQGERAYRPGCDVAHALGGHEAAAAEQRLGRPAVFHRMVEVRSHSGHRVEERAQPGAVRLTSREVSVSRARYSASNVSGLQPLLAGQGALSGVACEEEALDYEEEVAVQTAAVTKESSSKRAVPGDRPAGSKKVLSSNLIRGEVTNVSGRAGAVSGNKSDNLSNVDVAIQVEDVGVQAGKIESSSGNRDSVSVGERHRQQNTLFGDPLVWFKYPGQYYPLAEHTTLLAKLRWACPIEPPRGLLELSHKEVQLKIRPP
ncbi:hypothetical protein NDU88_002844 [Pleurodeles waltl]|uniref:Uncharacterized protein n=1 Tax=Pleurodeles waltl TaxID=8319 RepID=A0AAV7KWK2_PLEWA|nr:hypothetical protein NDU88_002844 [Pleurodeles waltl]